MDSEEMSLFDKVECCVSIRMAAKRTVIEQMVELK